MIDPKGLRNGFDELKRAMERRGGRHLSGLQEAWAKDAEHLRLLKRAEALRAQQNELSAEFGRVKRAGGDVGEVQTRAAACKASMAETEEALKAAEAAVREVLLSLPNPPHASVPEGRTPEDNKVARGASEPAKPPFEPKDHQALGEALGILDFERGGRLAGSRFPVLVGKGARLERAIVQFMLDLAVGEHGYLEVAPPLLVNAETMTGTGQLPKFEEDLYKASDGLYLIPTAEVPLTNLHRGELLEASRLPLRYAAATACFRREAGSYGKDTRGLIRNHQFDKVELVWIAEPERSYEALESLTRHAEEPLRRLGLPYRVLELCAGDLGFSAAKTYDLEVWMPGEARWREVSSCSNCADFQARRIGIRVKREKGKPELAHTLNGSGVAAGRVLAAVLENGQQADGSVLLPEALRPYAGFDRLTR